ncbi:response regulator [bacterium]|nr:response regulator [bacterium]
MIILIVDDNEDNLYQLQVLLGASGYEVISAKNGRDALTLARKQPPDLIISDIFMPEMDGFTLCKEWQKDSKLHTIPFIFYTATYTDDRDREFALSLGAVRFIVKPEEPEKFLQTITKFLQQIESSDLSPVDTPQMGDTGFMEKYNATLVRKLEQRTLKLEEANRALEQDILKRKQVEAALRTSEEKYRNLVESIADIIYYTDNTGKIEHISPQVSRFGYTPEEIIKKGNFATFIHPDDVERVVAEFERTMTTGEGIPSEYRIFDSSGGVRWVEDRNKSVSDSSGNIIGNSGVLREISERKKAEEALQKSEHRYRLFFEDDLTGDYISTVDGKIIDCNPAFIQMLGFKSVEEARQTSITSLYAKPKERNTLIDLIKRNKIIKEYELHLQRRDGKSIIVLENAVGIFNEKRELEHIRVYLFDITDRKRAEEALRNSEAQLSNAMKIGHMGHWEYDVLSDKFIFNDLFYSIYRTTADEVGGYEMSSSEYAKRFVHPEDAALVGKEVRNAIENVDPNFSRQLEHRIVYADGEIGDIIVRFFIMKDDQGRTVRTYGVNQDITEQKQLEKQFLHAQKMEGIGRLAGGVAHDFNNMLQAILGNCELAKMMGELDDNMELTINEIEKAAKRSANLTGQLLAFARQQTIAPKVLDINDTISGMLKMLQRLIGEDIHLAWMPGNDIWNIMIDPTQIDQILANLTVNARDAIEETGKITVETQNISLEAEYVADHPESVTGDFVILAVSDDGSGMTKEVMEKIFDPFFTTKQSGQGTGLGLSTIFGIVKQNNGFVNVYSEPGDGTTFKIYLPRYIGEMEEVEAAGVSDDMLRGNETVLIVEDEKAVLNLAERILKSFGYQVHTANSPEDALALLAENDIKPNILITDVVMPSMNGRQLTEKIQKNQSDLKTLFMSGYTANVIAHRGVLEEGVEFIQKPFTAQGLAKKVREILDD